MDHRIFNVRTWSFCMHVPAVGWLGCSLHCPHCLLHCCYLLDKFGYRVPPVFRCWLKTFCRFIGLSFMKVWKKEMHNSTEVFESLWILTSPVKLTSHWFHFCWIASYFGCLLLCVDYECSHEMAILWYLNCELKGVPVGLTQGELKLSRCVICQIGSSVLRRK